MAGQRPGGLTALAVLNFIFGGIGALVTLFAFLAIGAAHSIGNAVEAHGGTVTSTGPSVTLLYVRVLLLALSAIFLIVSGVGFIGMKRFSGRTIGSLYGVVSLAGTAVGIVWLGFSPFDIVSLVYPILILIMCNATYKNHLVN